MRILELYDLFGFPQLIKTGTRETLESTTLLDHIATTSESNIVISRVMKQVPMIITWYTVYENSGELQQIA